MTITSNKHKDTLFCRLFGSTDRKDDALQLYNALAGAHHENPDDLEITTVEDTVYLGRKNDLSFLVGSDMMMVEHQSTYNPNMPLRGLHYLSQLYAKLAVMRDYDLYGTKLIELPTPRYVVLYFGTARRPESQVLRLSDSFAAGKGDLEVTATVLNCTGGMNQSIMDACKTLSEYSRFVAVEHSNRKAGLRGHDAVLATVDQCIREGVLADYLTAHRAEVLDLLFTIEDEERAMRVHMKALEQEALERGMNAGVAQGLEKGLEEGLAQGMEKGLAQGMEKGLAQGMEEGLEKGEVEGRAKEREALTARLRELGVDEGILEQALADTSAG